MWQTLIIIFRMWPYSFFFCFLFYCRVFSVKFSCDGTYVISGSDDTNLRLWKAKASEQLGVVRIASSKHLKFGIVLVSLKHSYKHCLTNFCSLGCFFSQVHTVKF